MRKFIPILSLLLLLGGHITAHAQCCTYTLSMNDSYGDGWNGATLQVLVNNVAQGTYSAANFGSTATISVCNGDSLELVYSPGQYENENSYILQDSSWNVVFQDGPTPAVGNVFGTVGNCNTQPLPGGFPCTAMPIDTGQCLPGSNVGFPGSGLNPNCANFTGADVWYTMQVPASGSLSFETLPGNINDTGIGVWRGSTCSNLQRIGCDDDGGTGYYSFLLLYGLTPGETIYIQVFGYGTSAGTFDICVEAIPEVALDSSELPLVLINTQNQTIIEDTKINCLMDIKYNGVGNLTYLNGPANVYSGHIGIEIRGASSASYPQHPYGFETRDAQGGNNNVPILGMPAENDWVLLSNYNDRSLVKNMLAFDLSAKMGHYSPRAQLCEVLIDSAYQGIYVISEKIKRDSNRVDISRLDPADTTGDQLTGGYILQQNYWNANNSFQSNYSPIDHPGFDIHFVYEYPDQFAIQPAQKSYIAGFIDSLETALYSPNFADPINGYRKYMDIPSFIDYFLVNEVSRNADGFKKSVFFHKDKYSKGGKLKFGPVWDFDWAWKDMAICNIYHGYSGAGWAHKNNDCFTDNYSTGWAVRLLQDSTFANELRCRYEEYRQTMLDTVRMFAYIDSVGTLVQNAKDRHFQKWPILGVSGPAPDFGAVATTYPGELDSLKSWISRRITWLDANIPGFCAPVGVSDGAGGLQVQCYPNPTRGGLTLAYDLRADADVSLRMYSATGAEVWASRPGLQGSGRHVLRVGTEALPAGMYVVKFELGSAVAMRKVVVLE